MVETYRYFEAHRVPPYTDDARRLVDAEAAANRRRLAVIEERQSLGYGVDDDDAGWARWYREREATLTALVEDERARRAGAA